MGGCATKPKVLTGDEAEAPAPVPPPAPKEEGLVKVLEGEAKKDEGIVADEEVKNRSLGNLFKEVIMMSEEANASAGNGSVNASALQEAEKINPVEEPTPAPVKETEAENMVDAPVKEEAENAPVVAPIDKTETSEEKKTEEPKSVAEAENAEVPVEKSEEQTQTPEEKKPEEVKPAIETQKLEASEEKKPE